MKTVVSERGQVTIPQTLREALGLRVMGCLGKGKSKTKSKSKSTDAFMARIRGEA
jgi:hypothetical protein